LSISAPPDNGVPMEKIGGKNAYKFVVILPYRLLLDPVNFGLDFAQQKVAHFLPHGIVVLSSLIKHFYFDKHRNIEFIN
jgi:hypothetical protein